MMLGKSSGSGTPQVATAQTVPAAPKPAPQRIISEPIAVTPEGTTTGATSTTGTAVTDTAAQQQKAFEDAVRAKMQAEIMKLQEDFNTDLKRKQAKNAPVASTPPAPEPLAAAPAEDRAAVSAAQLDQQRRETQVAETPRPAAPTPVQTQTTAPQPAVAAPAPAPAPQVAAVREGDVIAVNDLDVVPRITRASKPVYPPLALRQKITATVVLTVLVSENGDVLDVRVLRGEPRFGINDAAIRAMRATRFSPGIKDGKRVRTWFPQSIEFKAS
jgi:protein TonB